jgi:integrase
VCWEGTQSVLVVRLLLRGKALLRFHRREDKSSGRPRRSRCTHQVYRGQHHNQEGPQGSDPAGVLEAFPHLDAKLQHNQTQHPPVLRVWMAALVFTVLASMPIDQITAETIDVVKFRRPVIDRRTSKETGEMIECSRAYANQALRTLKSMIGNKEWKVLSERPSFTIPEAPGRDVLIDDAAEIAFERELGKSPTRSYARYRAWLVTMIMQDTGMRPSEVFEMRLENLRWAERRVWIPSGKTAKARRFVGMTERMHELLSSWCRGDEGPGWLFPSRSKTGHLMSILGSFQGARERAGLDDRIVPYCARHSYATFTVRATGNLFAVRDSMGHVDIKSMAPHQHQQTDELVVAVKKRNADRVSLSGVGHTFGHTNSLTA